MLAALEVNRFELSNGIQFTHDSKFRYPDIKKFIVQDLPETHEAAESFIASKGFTGCVEFKAQDFFKPQQRKGKYVFVMQRGSYVIMINFAKCLNNRVYPYGTVLHDWNTEDGKAFFAFHG